MAGDVDATWVYGGQTRDLSSLEDFPPTKKIVYNNKKKII